MGIEAPPAPLQRSLITGVEDMGIHGSGNIYDLGPRFERERGNISALPERRLWEIMYPMQGPQVVLPFGVQLIENEAGYTGCILGIKRIYPYFICLGRLPQPCQVGIRKTIGKGKILIPHERGIQEVHVGAAGTQENGRFPAGRHCHRSLGRKQPNGELTLRTIHQGILQLQVYSTADARFRSGRCTITHSLIMGRIED